MTKKKQVAEDKVVEDKAVEDKAVEDKVAENDRINEMVSRMRGVIKSIQHFMPRMEIPLDYLEVKDDIVEKLSDTEIKEAYDWLNNIFSNEYREVKEIWTCQDPKRWDLYDPIDDADMPEYRLLIKKLNALRKKIKARMKPLLLKKGKLNDTKEIKKESIKNSKAKSKGKNTK